MDRLLYIAMNGASSAMREQVHTTHNLANASTTGFRADLAALTTATVNASGTRSYVQLAGVGADTGNGHVQTTGRDLDVAVNDGGWLVVQTPEGGEAVSRRGDLQIDPFGRMTNGAGDPIMGDNGPIAIPPFASMEIAPDGTISIVPLGQDATAQSVVDRLKLVRVEDPSQLEKGLDGLLRLKDGGELVADASVRVIPGALEGSNVNPVAAMVRMIELSRSFESQTRLMQMASENDRLSAEIMQVS
ncbi:flagellar basal body rod protein FlgF [Porticoccus sp. GXU_MW_L64]